MAYASGVLKSFAGYGVRGILNRGARVLELGAQELNPDVTTEEIHEFIARFNPDQDDSGQSYSDLCGGFVGKVYEKGGFEYRSIDMYDGYRTLMLDLNHEDLPEKYMGYFEFVTNFGTTEHLINQFHAFEIIHDALVNGGYAFHTVPFTGYFNHGLINYHPKFFLLLAVANDYRIVQWGLSRPHLHYKIADIEQIPGSQGWQQKELPSGMMTFLLQKTTDSKFRPPLDLDLRRFSNDIPEDIQKILSVSCS
jgi:hypothetical protein